MAATEQPSRRPGGVSAGVWLWSGIVGITAALGYLWVARARSH